MYTVYQDVDIDIESYVFTLMLERSSPTIEDTQPQAAQHSSQSCTKSMGFAFLDGSDFAVENLGRKSTNQSCDPGLWCSSYCLKRVQNYRYLLERLKCLLWITLDGAKPLLVPASHERLISLGRVG